MVTNLVASGLQMRHFHKQIPRKGGVLTQPRDVDCFHGFLHFVQNHPVHVQGLKDGERANQNARFSSGHSYRAAATRQPLCRPLTSSGRCGDQAVTEATALKCLTHLQHVTAWPLSTPPAGRWPLAVKPLRPALLLTCLGPLSKALGSVAIVSAPLRGQGKDGGQAGRLGGVRQSAMAPPPAPDGHLPAPDQPGQRRQGQWEANPL